MKFEHVALNVSDPCALAAWYQDNVGLTIARRMVDPPYTHFLRDSGGRMLLEIYNNPPQEVPDYAGMNPLLLHLAFVSEDPGRDLQRLVHSGATLVREDHLEDGSHLVMLRDPWGIPIQLCKRSQSMFVGEEN